MKYWKDWPIKTINKEAFPKSLLKVPSCPKKIFYRGEWNDSLFNKTIAVVGSRQISNYGKNAIKELMLKIVEKNTTVVSGFMYGVDSWAHNECLKLGGKTIAVLGNGLDILYPKENDQLYSQILNSGGLVISEYENKMHGNKWTFPQRNRIVAGLSTIGILVVEAKIKSGSLITAKLGMKMNKKIMAVPGNIDSSVSEGTNWLIKSKVAKMINCGGDIFKDVIESPQQELLFQDFRSLSDSEKNIISILENEAISLIGICRKVEKEKAEVEKTLSEMLFKNLITKNGDYFYLA
jgi:DNA processing protein